MLYLNWCEADNGISWSDNIDTSMFENFLRAFSINEHKGGMQFYVAFAKNLIDSSKNLSVLPISDFEQKNFITFKQFLIEDSNLIEKLI